MSKSYKILWLYEVKKDMDEIFLKEYGQNGSWLSCSQDLSTTKDQSYI